MDYYSSHHAHPWHSLGNAVAGVIAELAKRQATPSSDITNQYSKYTAYATITAKRIATIEAHCRANTNREQAVLRPPPLYYQPCGASCLRSSRNHGEGGMTPYSIASLFQGVR